MWRVTGHPTVGMSRYLILIIGLLEGIHMLHIVVSVLITVSYGRVGRCGYHLPFDRWNISVNTSCLQEQMMGQRALTYIG